MLTMNMKRGDSVVLYSVEDGTLIGFIHTELRGAVQGTKTKVGLSLPESIGVVRQGLTGWRNKSARELDCIPFGAIVPRRNLSADKSA